MSAIGEDPFYYHVPPGATSNVPVEPDFALKQMQQKQSQKLLEKKLLMMFPIQEIIIGVVML